MVLIDSYIAASLEEQIVNLGHSSLMLEQSAHTAAFKRLSMGFSFLRSYLQTINIVRPAKPAFSSDFCVCVRTACVFFSYGELILFTWSDSRQERLVVGLCFGFFWLLLFFFSSGNSTSATNLWLFCILNPHLLLTLPERWPPHPWLVWEP